MCNSEKAKGVPELSRGNSKDRSHLATARKQDET